MTRGPMDPIFYPVCKLALCASGGLDSGGTLIPPHRERGTCHAWDRRGEIGFYTRGKRKSGIFGRAYLHQCETLANAIGCMCWR